MLKKQIKSVKPLPPKRQNKKLFDLASTHTTVAAPESTDTGILKTQDTAMNSPRQMVVNGKIISEGVISEALHTVPAIMFEPTPAVTFMSAEDVVDVISEKEPMPSQSTVFGCTGPDYYVQGKMLGAINKYVKDNLLDPNDTIAPQIASILREVFENTLSYRIDLALNEFAVKVMAEARNWIYTKLGDDMYGLTPMPMNAINVQQTGRPYVQNDPFEIDAPRSFFIPGNVTKIVNRYGSSEQRVTKELMAYLEMEKIRIVDGTVTNAMEQMFDNVVKYASRIIFSDFKKGVDEMEPMYCEFMDYISEYIQGMYMPLYSACLSAHNNAMEILKLRSQICSGNNNIDNDDYY